jgi:hypothetical protein
MERNEILRLVGSEPGKSIVSSELDRIEEFSCSDMIPIEEWNFSDYTQLGFTILSKVFEDGRAKFIQAVFPQGWKKILKKEYDWRVEIIDQKGRVRVDINYKPSDYAYSNFKTRYEIQYDQDCPVNTSAAKIVIDNSNKQTVFKSGIVDLNRFDLSRQLADQIAHDWLNANYPLWLSYSAYWD